MSMHLQYNKLFSIETQASNNINVKPEIFKYSPTKICQKLLGKFGLIYNTFQMVLLCIINLIKRVQTMIN